MADSHKIKLKSVCSTCLSVDRKLSPIRYDCVPILFSLISEAVELQELISNTDIKMFNMCWECTSVMNKLYSFREQVCHAQNHLSDVANGEANIDSKDCLSKLSFIHQTSYNNELIFNENTLDDLTDCKSDVVQVKIEADLENLLSDITYIESPFEEEVKSSYEDEDDDPDWNEDLVTEVKENTRLKHKKNIERPLRRRRHCTKEKREEDIYTEVQITEGEMLENIERCRLMESYVNAASKCETCVVAFKSDSELKEHNAKHHVQKPFSLYLECEICKRYISCKCFKDHKYSHYLKYACKSCDRVCYDPSEMLTHLKIKHSVGWYLVPTLLKRARKAVTRKKIIRGPRGQPRKKMQAPDNYPCTECDLSFNTYHRRYEHVLKAHREGFPCPTCGRSFYLKKMLIRHELCVHGTKVMEKCNLCGKTIKTENMKAHMLRHTQDPLFECAQCDKRYPTRGALNAHFASSKAHAVPDAEKVFPCVACNKVFTRLCSYKYHLKYAKCHFSGEHRYKCSECEKTFHSPGELRDHVNFSHRGSTLHKCPICDKALSSFKVVNRHIKDVHRGIKMARNKICETCGKAFRTTRTLKSHELVHTGERPLSCDICGVTFRQHAALYTHKRRVHKMPLRKKALQLVNEADLKENCEN